MEVVNDSIIERIKNKDEEAFRIFFKVYKPKIFYIAYKELQNKHDAEDCVQEVFLKILKNINNYNKSMACLNTWVIMMTRNCIMDIRKTRKINEERCIVDPLLVYCRGIKNNYDIEVLLSEIEQLIGEEKYRVLTLKNAFNLSFTEIGETLKIHPSKAKYLFYEGYKLAKEYINEKEKKINEKEEDR